MQTLDSRNATQLISKYAKYEGLYATEGTAENLLSVTDSLYCSDMTLVIDDKHTYSVPKLQIEFDNMPDGTVFVTGEFASCNIYASQRLDGTVLSSQFYQFIRYMLVRLEQHYYRLYNAEQLSSYVQGILKENLITEQIDFTCGEGISNLTNTHITIGIEPYILDRLGDYLDVDYTSSILETYSSLPSIIECVRRKTVFNTRLQCYNRSSAKTIIRKAYHQDARKIHSGLGYYIEDDLFSLIDIKTCTNTELDELRAQYGNLLQVRMNTKPTSRDMWVAKNEIQLEQLKTRCNKKGYSYRVELRDDGKTYNVIYRQYLACAVCFGPVNLETYETRYTDIAKNLFRY